MYQSNRGLLQNAGYASNDYRTRNCECFRIGLLTRALQVAQQSGDEALIIRTRLIQADIMARQGESG